MATAAQLTSALANAQHSTGPRTSEGKIAASRNALKLGIFSQTDVLPGEDPAAFQQLLREYEDHFLPVGPFETQLVRDIARSIWIERRLDRIEAEFYHVRHNALSADELQHALGVIYIQDSEGPNVLAKIERQRNAVRRKFWTARKELILLQQQRSQEDEPVIEPAINQIPRNPVRFDSFPDALNPSPWSGCPTPVHTPKDNWDNPALRL